MRDFPSIVITIEKIVHIDLGKYHKACPMPWEWEWEKCLLLKSNPYICFICNWGIQTHTDYLFYIQLRDSNSYCLHVVVIHEGEINAKSSPLIIGMSLQPATTKVGEKVHSSTHCSVRNSRTLRVKNNKTNISKSVEDN